MRVRPAKLLLVTLIVFCAVSFIWILSSTNADSSTESSNKIVQRDNFNHSAPLYNSSLLKIVMNHNEQYHIYNSDKFDANPTNVIVIQVHRRLEYLHVLIDSLRTVRDIEQCLIVFSHDYYDDQINLLVRSIDFVRYAQIFYPFSNQIWFGTFPGQSIFDCPRDISKQAAIEMNCLNAYHPDHFGHYRETKITQTKHHWWWKINHIFEHFQPLIDRQFELALIEEDHFFVPDFLVVWKIMSKLRQDNAADLITLGNYERFPERSNMNEAKLTNWWSSKHNMGMIIDRKFWNDLKSFSKQFCSYDDYNWDWTLQYLMKNSFRRPVQTLMTSFPRVIHIGSCGLHVKDKDCSPNKKITAIEELLLNRKSQLFPKQMTVSRTTASKLKIRLNGGWGDNRDHELCRQYSLKDLQIIETNSNFRPFLVDLR